MATGIPLPKDSGIPPMISGFIYDFFQIGSNRIVTDDMFDFM